MNTRITSTQCATKACCMGPLAAHTHTHLTALFPGLPGWAGTRKVKPIWILLKQETVSGSGISWAVCKSAPHSRQITMPASDYSVFLQASLYQCVVIVRWWIVVWLPGLLHGNTREVCWSHYSSLCRPRNRRSPSCEFYLAVLLLPYYATCTDIFCIYVQTKTKIN